MTQRPLWPLASLWLALSLPAAAQHPAHHPHHPAAPAASAAASAPSSRWADAEVRRTDPAAGKATLRHAPLEHLAMPGMTMVFAFRDAASVAQLKAGDQIRIQVEKTTSGFVVVAWERAASTH